MSSLGYAILGLLARGELSGYDIARKMKMPLGFFWHAKHSQIYPELAKLAALRLVRERRVVQQGRPNKRVYSLSRLGESQLRSWATREVTPTPTRDELLLKTYSLWLAEPGQALRLFSSEAQRHRERLAEYERIRRGLRRERGRKLEDPGASDFSTYATLVRGIGYEREYLRWCEWVAQRLRRTAFKPGTRVRRQA